MSFKQPLVTIGLFALLLGGGVLAAPAPSAHPAGYHIIHKFHLGGSGWWDYMTIDAPRQHLFISRATHVLVVNTDTGKVIATIPHTPGVHGIALAPSLNRGFISDGGANQVTVFNLKTLKTIRTVKVTGKGPDCIIYDPYTQRVFTFNGRTDNSTAIDARTLKVVGTVALKGRPEYATSDGKGHIYNNLEDKSLIDVINPRTLQVVKQYNLAPCQHPSGMAIDATHERLFSGCHSGVMAIVNARSGKVISTIPIGPGVDANRYDPATHLAFSSNGGNGTLTVVREITPNRFVLLGNVKTERGARTMAVDAKTHNVFLVTAKFGPRPKRRPGQRFRFPKMIPNSFVLLELAR